MKGRKLQKGNVIFLFFAILVGIVIYLAFERPLPSKKFLYHGVVLENRYLLIRLNSFNLCKIRLKSGEEIEARCSKSEKAGNSVAVAKDKGFGNNHIYIVQLTKSIENQRKINSKNQ